MDLVIVLISLAFATLALFLKLWRRAAYYVLCVVPIAISFPLEKAEHDYHFGVRVAMALEKSKYESCKRSGVTLGNGSVLNVCAENSDWTDWGFSESVVYDSSDELARTKQDYSASWRSAAKSLKEKAPFGAEGFDALPLGSHFYLVTFYDDANSNI
ncbi:hypothetical protein AB1286_21540 [Trinickia sp. NRRL B-1857]|uniref:hypothetical protein n=1 Tax=Trinickia sp. NRRL B-1857 TaxID=3162879 RepID=UPI003D2C3441